MRLYLDSFDFINLIERGTAGISVDEFRAFLRERGHTVVLSFPTICELIAPLWDPESTTVITRTMNTLESLPHEWIDLVSVPNLEVREALRSIKEGSPYTAVSPYVGNYLATILNAPEVLKLALNYSLSEAAFDLWRSGSFDPRKQRDRHVRVYRKLMEEDRKLISSMADKQKARRELLVQIVVGRIKAFRLYATEDGKNEALFEACARRVPQESEWCRGLKLVFSTFHSLMDNVGDKLQDSDLGDLSHVYAVPYVDYFTTDRRIASHVKPATKPLGAKQDAKIMPNIKALIEVLR